VRCPSCQGARVRARQHQRVYRQPARGGAGLYRRALASVHAIMLAYIAYSCTPEMCQVLVPLDMGSQPGVR